MAKSIGNWLREQLFLAVHGEKSGMHGEIGRRACDLACRVRGKDSLEGDATVFFDAGLFGGPADAMINHQARALYGVECARLGNLGSSMWAELGTGMNLLIHAMRQDDITNHLYSDAQRSALYCALLHKYTILGGVEFHLRDWSEGPFDVPMNVGIAPMALNRLAREHGSLAAALAQIEPYMAPGATVVGAFPRHLLRCERGQDPATFLDSCYYHRCLEMLWTERLSKWVVFKEMAYEQFVACWGRPPVLMGELDEDMRKVGFKLVEVTQHTHAPVVPHATVCQGLLMVHASLALFRANPDQFGLPGLAGLASDIQAIVKVVDEGRKRDGFPNDFAAESAVFYPVWEKVG